MFADSASTMVTIPTFDNGFETSLRREIVYETNFREFCEIREIKSTRKKNFFFRFSELAKLVFLH